MKIKRITAFILTVVLILMPLSVQVFAKAKPVELSYTPKYHYKTLHTGIRMSYVEFGDKKGEVVVLLHGATDSYISFSQVGTYLANMGYYVYIPELRGHGNTTKPEDTPYSPDLLAADIDSWMKQVNIDNAHVVGHSLGSFVAQELAVNYPDRVNSLTLIGSSNKMADNPVVDWLLNGDDEFPGLYGFDGVIPDEFVEDWSYSTNYDPDFVSYSYNHARSLPYYVWINPFSSLDIDNTDKLADITVPVQIIWGSNDDFFSMEDQTALMDSLISAEEIVFIEKTRRGHNTHWEDEMGLEIANDIADFLN